MHGLVIGALMLLAASATLLIWANRRSLRRIDRRLYALEHVLLEHWERREAARLVAHADSPADRRHGLHVVPKSIAVGGAVGILVRWLQEKPIQAVSIAGMSTAIALVPGADPETRLPVAPPLPPVAAPATPQPSGEDATTATDPPPRHDATTPADRPDAERPAPAAYSPAEAHGFPEPDAGLVQPTGPPALPDPSAPPDGDPDGGDDQDGDEPDPLDPDAGCLLHLEIIELSVCLPTPSTAV